MGSSGDEDEADVILARYVEARAIYDACTHDWQPETILSSLNVLVCARCGWAECLFDDEKGGGDGQR